MQLAATRMSSSLGSCPSVAGRACSWLKEACSLTREVALPMLSGKRSSLHALLALRLLACLSHCRDIAVLSASLHAFSCCQCSFWHAQIFAKMQGPCRCQCTKHMSSEQGM